MEDHAKNDPPIMPDHAASFQPVASVRGPTRAIVNGQGSLPINRHDGRRAQRNKKPPQDACGGGCGL
jgi:hypothetical protein